MTLGHKPSALEIRQLRAFVALVDRGSITAAAESLGLSQSTASEALAALERVLGTPLVVRRRGARELPLTVAGRALLPHARGVLEAVDAAHVAIAEATTGALASVEIITNESVSTYVLPPVLRELRERWANTRFAVTVETCPGVRAGISRGAFDVGLVLEGPESGAAATGAGDDPGEDSPEHFVVARDVALVVFATPAHPLLRDASPARRGPAVGTRRDVLAGFPLFLSDAAGDFHTLVRRYFESDGVPGPRLEAAGSVEGVKRGVAADASALGILPAYAVAEELAAGRIATLDVRPPPPRMRLDVMLPSARPRHPAAAELVDGVRRALARPA
jgi:LysR family hydrogen peroxide-inducible transcriptional activator